RHTRSYGDWSSDVCSSDLPPAILDSSGENSVLSSHAAIIMGQTHIVVVQDASAAAAGLAHDLVSHGFSIEVVTTISAARERFRRDRKSVVEGKRGESGARR